MPTGYTAVIDDHPEMPTKQWVMEHLARAFGVLVTLRDEDSNLTEEQIRAKLMEDSSVEYNAKGLKEAQVMKKEIAKRTEEEWVNLWEKSEAEKIVSNAKSLTHSQKEQSRHFIVRQELVTVLTAKGVGPVTKNIVKFGIEQLDLVAHDSKPYIQEPETLAHFKAETIRTNNRDIAYHTKELRQAKRRLKSRLEAYDRLKTDLDRVLVSSVQSSEVNKQ